MVDCPEIDLAQGLKHSEYEMNLKHLLYLINNYINSSHKLNTKLTIRLKA